MIEAVLENPTLTSINATHVPVSQDLKEKIEDLHMLTDHLSFLQESAT